MCPECGTDAIRHIEQARQAVERGVARYPKLATSFLGWAGILVATLTTTLLPVTATVAIILFIVFVMSVSDLEPTNGRRKK